VRKIMLTSSMSPCLTGRTLRVAIAVALAFCLAAPQATQATNGGCPGPGVHWIVDSGGTLKVYSDSGTTIVITCVDGRVHVNGVPVYLPDGLGGGPMFGHLVMGLEVVNSSGALGSAAQLEVDLSGVTADCFTALGASKIVADITEEDDLTPSPISDPFGRQAFCSAVPTLGLVTFVWLTASRRRRARS